MIKKMLRKEKKKNRSENNWKERENRKDRIVEKETKEKGERWTTNTRR